MIPGQCRRLEKSSVQISWVSNMRTSDRRLSTALAAYYPSVNCHEVSFTATCFVPCATLWNRSLLTFSPEYEIARFQARCAIIVYRSKHNQLRLRLSWLALLIQNSALSSVMYSDCSVRTSSTKLCTSRTRDSDYSLLRTWRGAISTNALCVYLYRLMKYFEYIQVHKRHNLKEDFVPKKNFRLTSPATSLEMIPTATPHHIDNITQPQTMR